MRASGQHRGINLRYAYDGDDDDHNDDDEGDDKNDDDDVEGDGKNDDNTHTGLDFGAQVARPCHWRRHVQHLPPQLYVGYTAKKRQGTRCRGQKIWQER